MKYALIILFAVVFAGCLSGEMRLCVNSNACDEPVKDPATAKYNEVHFGEAKWQ